MSKDKLFVPLDFVVWNGCVPLVPLAIAKYLATPLAVQSIPTPPRFVRGFVVRGGGIETHRRVVSQGIEIPAPNCRVSEAEAHTVTHAGVESCSLIR